MTLATFDPTRCASNFTRSGGNTVVTHTATSDDVAFLQYSRTTGKYWIELLFGSGNNVEGNAFGVGNASASSANGQYLGIDTNSIQIYEDSTRGTWYLYYNNAIVGSAIKTGGPQSAVGSVLVLRVDCDNRKLFAGIQVAGTGSVVWITDNPNTTPSGGIPWTFSGAGAPAWESFYSGTVMTLRAPGAFTATGSKPGADIEGWDDASGGATIVDGDMASAGVATAAFVGGGYRTGVYAGAGVATPNLLASAISLALANAAGVATDAGQGAAIATTVLADAGTSAGAFAGQGFSATALNTAGQASTALTAGCTASGVYASPGAAAAALQAAGFVLSAFAAAGVASSSMEGQAIEGGPGGLMVTGGSSSASFEAENTAQVMRGPRILVHATPPRPHGNVVEAHFGSTSRAAAAVAGGAIAAAGMALAEQDAAHFAGDLIDPELGRFFALLLEAA